MIRHVLPRARGPIIVQTSLFAAIALGVQTGLTSV
jgi:peptide/nickel transport system permease protein